MDIETMIEKHRKDLRRLLKEARDGRSWGSPYDSRRIKVAMMLVHRYSIHALRVRQQYEA